MFSFSPVCSSPRLLWGRLGLCWDVCIALWKSISYQQKLIHQSTAFLPKYVIFMISFHFRKENLPWRSRTVVQPPLPPQNSYFCVGGPYFISRLSRGLQPQRLTFVGGQINVVLADRIACGSRRPHAVGEVRQCFSAIGFSVLTFAVAVCKHHCSTVQLHRCCIPSAVPSQH